MSFDGSWTSGRTMEEGGEREREMTMEGGRWAGWFQPTEKSDSLFTEVDGGGREKMNEWNGRRFCRE